MPASIRILFSLLAVVVTAIRSTASGSFTDDGGQAAAQWMVAQQRASGAVCMSGLLENGCSIQPYFVNRGLLALMYNNVSVAGFNQTQRGEILGMVHRWIDWYLDHLNHPDSYGVHGTVYDYKVVAGGKEQSVGTYDSSDSYAGTLLSLVATFHDVTGDATAVHGWKDALQIVLNAVNATMRQNHLTDAKPNYRVAFLEDNVEVWAGLVDYAKLVKSVGDLRHADVANAAAGLSRLAITDILWSIPSTDWVVNKGGRIANWTKFYPDAQAQLWPALVKFRSGRAADNCNSLAERFVAAQGSAWSRLQIDAFPHTMLGLPLVECGQREIVAKFLTSVQQKFFPAMQWPWHIAEAGGFVAAAQAIALTVPSVNEEARSPLRCVSSAGEVNVSCFGFDAADSTVVLQQALDSGATHVYIDRPPGSEELTEPIWVTRPLFVPGNSSNLHITLRTGVQLVAKRGEFREPADTLLSFGSLKSDLSPTSPTMTGVSLTCEAGAMLKMHRKDYDNQTQGMNYSHAEHRHALQFYKAENVLIDGCYIMDTGGDGVYLRDVKNAVIRRSKIERAYRNGISIISANGVLLEDVQIIDTNGTAPRSGVDIEPNKPDDGLQNITLRRVVVDGAGGCGIEIKHAWALKTSPVPVGVLVDSCIVRNIARSGIPIMPLRGGAQGEIRIRNTSTHNTGCAGLLIGDKASDGAAVVVESLSVSAASGACDASLSSYGLAPITVNVTHFHGCGKHPWPPGQTFGGVVFKETKVREIPDAPFFAVGRQTHGLNWHAVNVTGTVDVYESTNDTNECKLDLGPLGKQVALHSVCHSPSHVQEK
eukprot:COSAG02_NODE_2692_length_8222_cov_6.872584_5_plen_821_part_00